MRRAIADDMPAILAIERESFATDAWERAGFDEYFRHPDESVFLVAEDDGAVSGYAVAVKRRGIAELDSIAVLESNRRSGVGRQLLRRIIRTLKEDGVPSLWLMVRRDNEAAIRFYRAFGFERVRRVNHYYYDGGAAWRMRLKLLHRVLGLRRV